MNEKKLIIRISSKHIPSKVPPLKIFYPPITLLHFSVQVE